MKVFKSALELTNYLNNLRASDNKVTVGFVPTMGALHQGHLSLIKEAVKDHPISVCSIFVNPTQFGEKKDLETYPKPIDKDLELLMSVSCSIVFIPDVHEIYPEGYEQAHFELEGLDLKIEGAQRPGHFQGVCNVLKRFFEIISPDSAYFGQKDFQQTVVAKKLVQLLEAPIEIVVSPIARESHGLAMSSRNQRLSDARRMEARFIHDALQDIQANYRQLGLKKALENARIMLSSHQDAVLEYLTAVDASTLMEVDQVEGPTAIVTVVRVDGVRLLDNVLLEP